MLRKGDVLEDGVVLVEDSAVKKAARGFGNEQHWSRQGERNSCLVAFRRKKRAPPLPPKKSQTAWGGP